MGLDAVHGAHGQARFNDPLNQPSNSAQFHDGFIPHRFLPPFFELASSFRGRDELSLRGEAGTTLAVEMLGISADSDRYRFRCGGIHPQTEALPMPSQTAVRASYYRRRTYQPPILENGGADPTPHNHDIPPTVSP
jgi:hypothetical protein